MAFPVSPTNGQTAVVNNITYQFSNVGNTWTRLVSTANVITANTIISNGYISASGNVTGGNLLTSGIISTTGTLSVSGNTTVANVSAGNISAGSLNTSGVISATGNLAGGNVLTSGVVSAVGTITGTSHLGSVVSVTANITGGNILTGGLVSAAGNVTGNYFIGNGSQLTGVVATGVGTLATLSVTGNTTTGNLLTGGLVSAVGTITGSSFSGAGTGLTGTASSLTVGSATTAGTVTTAAQPNITSIGTLTSLTVSGNTTSGNILTGGIVSATGNIVSANNIIASKVVTANDNIVINSTGVEGGQLVLAWSNVNGLIAQGNSTWNLDTDAGNNFRLFYQNGAAATSVLLSVSPSTNVVSFTNSAGISATGNISGANLLTGGLVSAVANITGGNLLTVGQISATGTITSNAATNSTGFAVGNGAVSNVALGMFPTAGRAGDYAIRDYSTVTNSIYFDVGMGGTANGQFQFRTTNAYTQLATITSTGVNTPYAVSAAGNVTGSYFIGNGSQLTGIATGTPSQIVNGTSNVVVAASGNITVGVAGSAAVATFYTGGIIANSIAATSNGNGTNFKVGDDAWIGDINVADTMSIRGQQSALNGYIVFGNADGTQLGRAGSGPLTYGAAFSAVGNVTGGNLLTVGLVSATSTITSAANITGGNLLTAGLVSVTGNVTGGNVLTAGLVSATSTITSSANITGGNLLTAGLISATGTVTGSSHLGSVVSVTANVTGGNVLSSAIVSAVANITGGNILTAGQVSATGNVVGGNVNTSALRPLSGSLTISTVAGNLNLSPTTGNIVVNSTYINGVSDPVQNQDVATKAYVDNFAAQGLSYHSPVVAATTANLATTTGGIITYTQPNGAANGVGALLTTTGSFNLIDTANVQTVGTRILVKNEGNSVYNGVYTWANATNIIRSTDTDEYGSDSANAFSLNDYFFVSSGNVNAGSAWVVNTPTGTITFGTSNITFAQFSSSQTYTANTSAGITLVGTVINAKVDNTTTAFDGSGNISVKASANLTTPNIGAATGTSLSTTGNVTGGNLLTAGLVSATSTITSAANISGGNILTGGLISATGTVTANSISVNRSSYLGTANTSYVEIFGGNINPVIRATGNAVAGLVFSSTGTGNHVFNNGNSGSQGTNTGLAITGFGQNYFDLRGGGSLQPITLQASGTDTNIDIVLSPGGTGNLTTSARFSAGGNVIGSNLLTAGIVSATGNITGGNLIISGILTVTGNIISVANISGGNLLTGGVISATGNITGGNILTAGIMSSTGNATHGNILTAGQISATGNITGNYYIGNGAFLTGLNAGTADKIANGATNISIPVASGNIAMSVAGQSNTVVINLGSFTMYGAFAGPKTLQANVTVADSVNALLMGPISIGNNYNITVPGSSTLYVYAP